MEVGLGSQTIVGTQNELANIQSNQWMSISLDHDFMIIHIYS
jgi:hypothetical protein